MGFRYSDREIERFKRDYVYKQALSIARMGDAPIDPDRDEYEAIEFLFNIFLEMDELIGDTDMSEGPFDYDIAQDISDSVIPYNNYKAAMAYAQLGLYDYDEMFGGLSPRPDTEMDMIRHRLATFAYNVVNKRLYDF